MTGLATKPIIEVVCAADAHMAALARFYRTVWDPEASTESVTRARIKAAVENPVETGQSVPCYLFVRDGEVLGHIGCIPARFWDGVRTHVSTWFNGFMVLPEHRNGPVGFSVLKEALRNEPLAAVLTVALPSRRLFKALGFTDYGAVPNYLLLLRATAVFQAIDFTKLGLGGRVAQLSAVMRIVQRIGAAWLVGALASVGLACWRRVRTSGLRASRLEIGNSKPSAGELNTLWDNLRPKFSGVQVRDAAYIEWRYGAQRPEEYQFASVRTGGALCGFAVVRPPREQSDDRLAGLRVATVSDILFSPDDIGVGIAALTGAARLARQMDADVLLCTASHPALAGALQRQAFVRLSGNAHFMMRDAHTRKWPQALTDWWITRGDAEADGTF